MTEDGKTCEWCAGSVTDSVTTVYWELPDGTRSIEIHEVPGILCRSCGMEYQEEEVIMDIEDQLMLMDTKTIPKAVRFDELLQMPRFLKKNYFRF
ncbi:YokU family protein [Rossellomorea marisflavi]|uniref:YokU family protein n=1 Tax=Rossellomorea marisflavi TaxID=189381 RepID=UPI003514B4C1